MDTNFTLSKTTQIGGGFIFPNIPEDMEVDEDRKNELMTTKKGNMINFLREPAEEMEVNVCLWKTDVNISILKKGRETSKERERRNLREYRVVPGRDDGEMVVDIKTPEDMEVDEDNKNELMTTKNGNIIHFLRKPEEGMEVNVCLGKSDVNISILKKGRETSKKRVRRNLREYRVVPGRDDCDMVVDIKTGKQGVESPALELSRSDVVKLEIKGKVHLMEPTSQSYSGCHSKCTVFKDINNTGFEAAHKMATDNDIEMCLYLKDTNIPPQVYRIIPRTGGKAHIFMEFISPSVSLYSVITEHMSVLEGKGMEKTFTYRAIIYLLKAFIIMKAKGISHGDLHAGNILIQLVINDFVPRFIDFEFSRIILGNSRGPDRDFSFISTVIADLCKAACKRSGDNLLNRFIEYKLEIHNIEEATRIIRETELHATLYATGNAEMIKVFSDIVHASETADKFKRLHIGKKQVISTGSKQ